MGAGASLNVASSTLTDVRASAMKLTKIYKGIFKGVLQLR